MRRTGETNPSPDGPPQLTKESTDSNPAFASQGSNPQSTDPENDVSRRAFLRTMAAWLAGGTACAMALTKGMDTVTAHGSHYNIQSGQPDPTDANGKRLRRWAMAIDLRRCDGCQSVGKPPQCTAACIQGHFVPEPMEWIQVFEPELPGGGTQFVPMPCQQCQNPPCVNVCPVAATFTTPEGVVLIDQERCIGCRICMEACPYDRRFFNWGKSPQPPQAMFMDYHPEHQSVAYKGTVMKCDFCPDMARDWSACPIALRPARTTPSTTVILRKIWQRTVSK